ncbi:MAG TPA: FecR domain-containing protein [Puia sp.]|nr:FecR domain-containing protein [Puia sp.]
MDNSAMQKLLDRYLSGACTTEEQLKVEQWLEQQQNAGNEWTEMDAPAKAAWMARLHQDVQHTIKTRALAGENTTLRETATPKIPIYKRPFPRMAAAAAIILVIGAGAWWLKQGFSHDVVKIREADLQLNDVLPGGNKAILTLANGSTITLDSAANGKLTQQGNTTVLKADNGQLAYNAVNERPTEVVYNTLATPRGGQYRLVLPDGSKVWLNAASSIYYPTAFIGKERKVSITGEVYFEVTENADMPFIVEATTYSGNKGEVKVLGTHFDVNAYNDEETMNTTLLEGSVLVKKDRATAMLKPGQQAQLAKEGGIKLVNDADLEEIVAWKNGKISCRNMDLENIMRQVARWYDVEVVYEDRIPDRYTVSVSRDVPVSQLLRFLQESQGVHFRIEGKKITVLK